MKKIFTFLFSAMAFGAFAQGSNGTMETWVNYNAGIFPPVALEEPAGWHGSDSLICTYGPILAPGTTFSKQIFKSTDKHSGTYAAMIMSSINDSLGAYTGLLTNALISVDLTSMDATYSGGYAVSQRMNYASAWIKYVPRGTDSASILVEAVKTGAGANGDSVLGGGEMLIGATPSYTSFSVPIIYNDTSITPDAIRITFTSSYNDATDSTMLYVDDVTVGMFPVGIKPIVKQVNAITLYPNPAQNELNISNNLQEAVHIDLFDEHGRLIYRKMVEGKAQVDLSAYAAGQYFFVVHDKNNALMQTGKFNVIK